jgi:hypothetical protein
MNARDWHSGKTVEIGATTIDGESIGAIAAALAKAQAELTNPEKSLVGIIGPSSPRDRGARLPVRSAVQRP